MSRPPRSAWVIVAVLGIGLLALPIVASISQAELPYYMRRDLLWLEWEQWRGVRPKEGKSHYFGLIHSAEIDQVSFVMDKSMALYLRIFPTGERRARPAGFVMLASHHAVNRDLKPVFRHDDLREPLFMWTDKFWSPRYPCDTNGCPLIRFQATRGRLGITILKKQGIKLRNRHR